MNYREALNLILREYPGPTDALQQQAAKDYFRRHQLDCAARRLEGWAWMRREAIIDFSGGYDTGAATFTKDSTGVTIVDGVFPASVGDGWIIGPTVAATERYEVLVRDSDTVLTLKRPYIHDTIDGVTYSVFDPKGVLPIDYMMGESMVAESEGRQLGFLNLGYARGHFPAPLLLGQIRVVMMAEPSSKATLSSDTVTIATGDATVTIVTTPWPANCVGKHLRFEDETVWYKIGARTSDAAVELTRPYNGPNAGAGKSYEYEPAGALQIESIHPKESKFTIKLIYFAWPEEPVNDTDLIEGDESYARIICDFAAADLLSTMPQQMMEMYGTKIRMLQKRAEGSLADRISGRPEPRQDAVMHDIRWSGKAVW